MKSNENTFEPYVPDLGLVYPEKPDGRMTSFKIRHDVIVDKNYPFLDKTFKFKFLRCLGYLALFTLGPIVCFLRFGLKIEGRGNLRKHREILKNGAMTVCNHVQRWDFIFVVIAVRFHMMYFPVWKEQLKSSDAGLIRVVGGIPVPDDIQTINYFNRAFDEIHAHKKWIHVYPESSRFDYFQPIRPFKKGVFTMAHRYDLPVLPLAISWRKPLRFPVTLDNIFRSLKGEKKLPMITIRIGEPVLIDKSLGRKEAVLKLRKDCHEAVVSLAGIRDNPYPAEGN